MQKKWNIVLGIINIACLLAVTTVSVAVYAINNSRMITGGGGTVTVIGRNIPAAMSAGKQVGGETSSDILTETPVNGISSFAIGDVTVHAGGYVNVWFTVENQSDDNTAITVDVGLTDGNDAVFSAPNVTTEIYQAFWDGEAAHITDIDAFLEGLNTTLNTYSDPNQISEVLIENDISAAPNQITVSAGQKKSVIVRYNVGDDAATFGIGIHLTFSA